MTLMLKPTNPASILIDSMAIEEMADNILSVFYEATPSLIAAGNAWYEEGQELSVLVTNLVPTQACGIVAALSPQTSWAQNLTNAKTLVETRKAPTFGGSVAKALRILDGESPLEVLGGNKVRSFYRNLVDYLEHSYVTVDRHAINIALGGFVEGSGKAIEADRRYQKVATAYMVAAGSEGLIANQMQAITWLAWRTVHATAYAASDPNGS